MQEKKWKFTAIVVGDSGVGKTSLVDMFLHDKTCVSQNPSLFSVLYRKDVVIDEDQIRLGIRDIIQILKLLDQAYGHYPLLTKMPGKSKTGQFYRGAAAALLVYDVASRDSFNNLKTWVKHAQLIKTINPDKPPMINVLIGNKSDQANRQVTTEEGEAFALEHDYEFIETCAHTGDNVEEAFMIAVKAIHDRTTHSNFNIDHEKDFGIVLATIDCKVQKKSA